MKREIAKIRTRIGSRLKVARHAAQMTQEELAGITNRSVEAISNIERGASLPPIDTLILLANALSIDLSDFLNTVGEAQSAKREQIEMEIRLKLRSLDDEQAEIALKLIDALC